MTNEQYIELRSRLLNDPVVLRALARTLAEAPAPEPPHRTEDPELSYATCAELMGCSSKYVAKSVCLGRIEAHEGRVKLSALRTGVLRYSSVAVRTRFLENLERWQDERASSTAPRLRVVEPGRLAAEQPDLFSLPTALVALP